MLKQKSAGVRIPTTILLASKGLLGDYADKTVRDHNGSHDEDWLSLVEFAKAKGWRK